MSLPAICPRYLSYVTASPPPSSSDFMRFSPIEVTLPPRRPMSSVLNAPYLDPPFPNYLYYCRIWAGFAHLAA